MLGLELKFFNFGFIQFGISLQIEVDINSPSPPAYAHSKSRTISMKCDFRLEYDIGQDQQVINGADDSKAYRQ